MLAQIAMMAVLGLVRYDTAEPHPTPAPPMELYLFVWHDHSGAHYYTIGTDEESSRPQRATWEIWRVAMGMGNPIVIAPRYDVGCKRATPLRQLLKRAVADAQQEEEPPPCFPGEFPGHGAW